MTVVSDADRAPTMGDGPQAGQEVSLWGREYVLLSKARYLELNLRAQQGTPSFDTDWVGKDLRFRRRQASLTVLRVARRAGIAPETLSRIENGHGNPTLGTLKAILRAIGEESLTEKSKLRSQALPEAGEGPATAAVPRTSLGESISPE